MRWWAPNDDRNIVRKGGKQPPNPAPPPMASVGPPPPSPYAAPILPDRVLWNTDGTVDEIVVNNCTIHLEQMSDTAYWMGITKNGGSLHMDIGHGGKKPLLCTIWDDSEIPWEWDEDDRHDA